MRCSKASKQLQLYIDHELTLDQIRDLEVHLSSCNVCQEELFLLEEVTYALRDIQQVIEPADLTVNIMQRVAYSELQKEEVSYRLFRPSLPEVVSIIALATITTFFIIVSQPSLRASLPIANGHDALSLAFINLLNTITSMNGTTIMLALWIIGTVLGIWITLTAAGNELRSLWLKEMVDRLPVW